jgi:alpha-glucosidase
MHQRQTRWVSLGELRGSDTDARSLIYDFSHVRCGFSVSNDEWMKVELAFRHASVPETVQGHTGSVGARAASDVRPNPESPANPGGPGGPTNPESPDNPSGRSARSWALDLAAEARRRWRAADLDSPVSFTDHRAYRYAAGNEGVEGTANPHEDTRGIVPVEIAGERFLLPVTGRTGDGEAVGGGIHKLVDEPEVIPCGIRTSGERPNRTSASADGRMISPDTVNNLLNTMDEMEISRCRDGFLVSLPLPPGCRVYGLGEKTGGLDKSGRSWVMWNSDEPRHTPGRDPLYQSIPVAYVVGDAGTAVATVFVDATATIWFDLGEADPGRLQIEIYDTECTVYIRHDPALPPAVEAYTGLTGRMSLPPEWALGFQQCRYSYFPESRVLEIAERMRQLQVPCDVIYLDIHYMDGYRVFTWDPVRFPDPRTMIDELHRRGFHLVTIVDPGVKRDPDYHVFADGIREGAFLEDPGRGPYVGTVWPGEAVFPDFTDTRIQRWWAKHHRPLFDAGVDGIWNDMNEPADFSGPDEYRPDFTVPNGLICRNDGRPKSMERLHNVYGSGMNAATRAAMGQFLPEERGFVLTRSGYAGVQRNAAVWTGDNHSWWEHIRLAVPMLANLGLSGVAFCGGDVGGFQMNADGELYARWIAAASLMPFFRAHSALDTVDHEPWSFGDRVLDVARRYIGLRYRLMPYLYTLFEEASRTGAPVVRPLVWEFPRDPRVARRADSFMVGPAVLVAPVSEPGASERAVYLPAGIWYDFWSGERIDTRPDADDGNSGNPGNPGNGASGTGGRVVACDAPLERMPIFIRGGFVVPFEKVRQHTGQRGDGELRLLVAPDADGKAVGTVYGDAGEGFGYRDGQFWRARFQWDSTPPARTGRTGAAVTGSPAAGAMDITEEGSIEWTRWNNTRNVLAGPGREESLIST